MLMSPWRQQVAHTSSLSQQVAVMLAPRMLMNILMLRMRSQMNPHTAHQQRSSRRLIQVQKR